MSRVKQLVKGVQNDKSNAQTSTSRRHTICYQTWRELGRRLNSKMMKVNAPKPKCTANVSSQATNPMQNRILQTMPSQDRSVDACTWNFGIMSWPEQHVKGLKDDKSTAQASRSTIQDDSPRITPWLEAQLQSSFKIANPGITQVCQQPIPCRIDVEKPCYG